MTRDYDNYALLDSVTKSFKQKHTNLSKIPTLRQCDQIMKTRMVWYAQNTKV